MGPLRRPGTRRAPDALALTVVAWVRVGVAIMLAASGSIPDDLSDRAEALFLLVGFAWVPWSVVVLFASERPRSRLVLIGGPLGDVLVLLACQTLVPSTAEAVLSGQLLVIAFTAYFAGRVVAGYLTVGALSATLLARSLADDADRVEPSVLVTFAVAAVAIVLLLDRTTSLHARAAARALLLQSSSDAVLERIADGVVVTDGRGRVVSCNPAAERIIGRLGDRAGGACHELLGLRADERALVCSNGCALLCLDTDDDDAGHEVWRDDGGRRQPLLANATPIVDDDGEVVEIVHSIRDVSKLKQSEEAKTLFLATASHELKTPLTVIRGFVETLQLPELDDNQRSLALRAVHRRTIELGAIVDRLLLSSRIEAGRVELATSDVDLVDVLEERVLAMAASTGRIVDVDIDPGLGAVRGDPAALATVIDHLIDNAVKYSPGGGSIRVGAVDGDPIVVTVADQGIGMDTEQARRCFDKFWQAESTDVRRFGGTGIGLYIVRSLVEAMDGRITVQSGKGEGSTFRVELQPVVSLVDTQRGVGEATMIREFMRQIGVPERTP